MAERKSTKKVKRQPWSDAYSTSTIKTPKSGKRRVTMQSTGRGSATGRRSVARVTQSGRDGRVTKRSQRGAPNSQLGPQRTQVSTRIRTAKRARKATSSVTGRATARRVSAEARRRRRDR